MPVSILTPPEALPVSLSGIKQFLRIDQDDDDALLTQLAEAATAQVEAQIKQSLINRTVRQYVDCIPGCGSVLLEGWPVREIVKVTGFDESGSETVISADHFRGEIRLDPATISFSPRLNADHPNGIEIDFVCGYGESAQDVPSNIIHAINRLLAHWYEHRGAGNTEVAESFPVGIERLLAPVRRVRL